MLKLLIASLVNLLLAFCVCSAQDSTLGPDVALHFEQKIRPLLNQYCVECHQPGQMPGLEFLTATTEADLAALRGVYAGVVEQMESRAMPPRDFDQPTDAERTLVVDWIKKTLDITPRDTDRIAQYVVEVYEDRNGSLWFGTVSNGAIRYDGNSLTYFSTEDGLQANAVTSFTEDKSGNLWIGTQEGICKYDGAKITKYGEADGLSERGGNVFTDKAGNLWANMYFGIYRYDGSRFSEFELPIQKESLGVYRAIAGRAALDLEDSQGNLWFKTNGAGAFKFDGTTFTHFTTQDGLTTDYVTNILEDNEGKFWFSCLQEHDPKMTGDGGLCRFDGTRFEQFPNIQGLSNNDIYTLEKDRAGNIWIGATGIGVYRYDGKTFSLFNKTDRMHSTRYFGVQAILEDSKGTLWFGFSGGLFRFNGQSFFNVTKEGPWDGLAARKQYADLLVAPKGWLQEAIAIPPDFAPTMSIVGMEHLRLPPEFRKPDSDWFCSYLLAIELTEPVDLNEKLIAEQLLIYFRGLASGGEDKHGKAIETESFSIAPQEMVSGPAEREFVYVLHWQEPFVGATPLQQNIRVKVITNKNEHGVIFVCASPKGFESHVWKTLLQMRSQFELAK